MTESAGDDAGPHLADHAQSLADCRIARTLRVGSHMVVFGEVLRVTQRPAARPLLYGLRRAEFPA
jgi:flavin reductase (DIM6/NTAB) family NADH-FMN oxidoreductase RutF